MNIKSFICAFVLFLISQVYASNIYPISNGSLVFNNCDLTVTGHPLDLALNNDGYFVVSHGKKDSELLFTRYGSFLLNHDGHIVNNLGKYVLGINKKSDPKKLSKLKISMNNLPPKATTRVNIVINLPAMAPYDSTYIASSTLYDSISGSHNLKIEYTPFAPDRWTAKVSVDDIKLNTGILTFKADGNFSQQEGLSHILWPTTYGLQDLKIDHKESTAYAVPFSIHALNQNGYPLGMLEGLDVDMNGSLNLLYDNGQMKSLKHRIAVAKFMNPNYLVLVRDHLYRPTEQSGPQRLHWRNGDYAVLSGILEQVPCLAN